MAILNNRLLLICLSVVAAWLTWNIVVTTVF
jgi:hypothetical protein